MTTVTYNYSFKTTADFQSKSVHLGMTDDVRNGETPEEAMERVRRFVLGQALLDGAPHPRAAPPAQRTSAVATLPLDDVYTGRPEQVDYAYKLMDEAMVHNSDKVRDVLLRQFNGRFIRELPVVIREDQARMEAKRNGTNHSSRGGYSGDGYRRGNGR